MGGKSIVSRPAHPEFAVGANTDLPMPAQPDAMRQETATFLTHAFRAYGSIAPDNRVTRVTRFEPFAGGNSGLKLALSVEYEKQEAGLHPELFVKFSRDYTDAFRDRRRYEFDGEVRLAELARLPDFPVTVAKPYFADFDPETGTGLLITERIAFGQGRLEPLHHKCMDHELANPFEYYAQTIGALARLAGAHKAGRLSPHVERLFPFDPETAQADLPIPWTAGGLREKVSAWRDFVESCPRLFPANLRPAAFFDRLECDALRFLDREDEVRAFLHADADFVALCHWNTNLDNAWFWRDDHGSLHCGLLDWGMVRQMNVCYGLWGGLSASEGTFLKRELDGLLALFAREFADAGGARLDPGELAVHFDLSLALLGLALMMDTPALIRARLPEIAEMEGPLDPRLMDEKVVQGFLHVSRNFLDLWQSRDFGASLNAMLARR